MTQLTERQVRKELREWIGDRSLAEAGLAIGVSAPWLSLILSGRCTPSGKVLDVLGLARKKRGRSEKPLVFTKVSEQDCGMENTSSRLPSLNGGAA